MMVTMAVTVLIVEDNQDMQKGLEQFLDREGFKVFSVSSCEEGIDEVDENHYDAAIIDINLPGKSGFDLIEYIREQGHIFPLIAMTARDGIDDKIKGFDLGLTDYVVKPFDLKELLARLHAHLKITDDKKNEVLKTANFLLKPNSYEFKKNDKTIELTQLELRIMQVLMQKNHNLVPLDELINFVWGESEELVTPPIRIHIANLRKKIGDIDYRIIRTIPGTGYIFNDPLGDK
ncbi:response regulator transcription factor [Candidatus Saccharibacteria bacterium]|jgi:DNA-binding response OmpR family regulator|nr:response regulator transcription factor [Candidatus Saccharibacteria bacterium]